MVAIYAFKWQANKGKQLKKDFSAIADTLQSSGNMGTPKQFFFKLKYEIKNADKLHQEIWHI